MPNPLPLGAPHPCLSKSQLPQSELATDEKLNLLGLYKQAKMGDVNVPRPGAFDIKGRAKHDTWVKQKGKSQEDAMKEYVELVQALKEKYVK
jgi:diazepam-binding inhibitor (GABA receptor modulator, acyl-CoA-binding protein)